MQYQSLHHTAVAPSHEEAFLGKCQSTLLLAIVSTTLSYTVRLPDLPQTVSRLAFTDLFLHLSPAWPPEAGPGFVHPSFAHNFNPFEHEQSMRHSR